MSAPSRPHLKSLPTTPDGPQAAPQPVDAAAVGEPKGAARKGVRTSPDPHTTDVSDPTPERPGIRIYAPPVYRHHTDGARWSKRYSDTPTAAYACPCGQTDTATGPNSVAALIAKYEAHKHFCTEAPAALTEGRTAA
ncbi:hypothetical protein QWM81_23095 [Streptomyces ficellus]|uniref:Uncharacterized protein n=1 Tax=Streptomyces ficellus TaxID=1977088 RepID=A0ABT7ZBK4_9ACTN|nr:hypothetical protein [Streptomyces ficellus]MDN3296880.1 hypothetical protein [Streptomyces ficellus]